MDRIEHLTTRTLSTLGAPGPAPEERQTMRLESSRNMSEAIIVLGMHRSGTSAVSGTLMRLGGGSPKNLMPASDGNERGYFESVALMNFHDQLLESADSSWQDWREFNPGWRRSAVAADFRRRAKELFLEEFEGAALPVLKDPRICRFAPFWFEVLREMQIRPSIVIPIRSPLDVARSLSARQGLSLTHGLLLWLRHVLDAEAQSRNEARSIFTWPEFRENWRGVCERIGAETHISWPRLSDRASRGIERFLAKELVHHDTDHAALAAHGEVNDWTLRAYDALLELARNPHSNSALATLDEIRGLLDQSSQIFGRLLVDFEVELEELRNHANSAAREKEALQERENALASRVELAERTRDETVRDKASLAEALSLAIAEREGLQAENSRLVSELKSRQSELDQRTAALVDLVARTERDREEIARDRESLSRAIADRDALQAAHSTLAAELRTRQQELDEKTIALADYVERTERAQREREELQTAYASLAAELQSRRTELDEKTFALGEALARAERTQREREEFQNESASLAAELQSSRTKLDEALARAGRAERAHEDLQAGFARLAAELQSRQQEAAELFARADEAEQKAETARQTLANSLAEHEELGKARSGLEAELLSRRQELERKTTALSELSMRAQQAELRRDDLARQNKAVHRSLADAAAEHANARREMAEAARKQADAFSAELERASSELRSAREQADALSAELERASSELRFAREQAAAREAEQAQALARTRASDESEIASARAQLVDAEAALANAKARATRKGLGAWLAPAAPRRRLAKRLLTSGLFDVEFYGEQYPSANGDLGAVEHYIEQGYCSGFRPNPFFDTRWYLDRHEDVRRSGVNPLLHYILHGVEEGRDPSPHFQTSYYLEANPDVRDSGVNPLAHYLQYGRHEGRLPAPPA